MKKVFGEKQINQDYQVRRGCYAVIINDLKQFSTVLTSKGHYFLPGGGIEFGEEPEDCLNIEVLEETGYGIKIISFIGEAQRYFFSFSNEPLLSDGLFFLAEFTQKVLSLVDDDHFLEWVNVEQADRLLFHDHHSWAVKKALEGLN